MKNLCDPAIAKYRDHEADKFYRTKDEERPLGGAFMVPVPGTLGAFSKVSRLRVIASSGKGESDDYQWDHVSVSHSDRCPTWEEMDFIKRLFFKPEEVCMQLHVADAEHISNHPFCLHIWRPLQGKIPLPPSIMVGFPGLVLQP